MFKEFLKRQSDVFYIQLWPGRIKVTEMRSLKVFEDAPLIAYGDDEKEKTILAVGASCRSLENASCAIVSNAFYDGDQVFADLDCAAAVINHALYTLIKELPQKAFAPLIIFHPMSQACEELGVSDDEAKRFLVKRCGAKRAIIMAADEYLDLDGFR